MKTRTIETQTTSFHAPDYDMTKLLLATAFLSGKGFCRLPNEWPCSFMAWRFEYVFIDGFTVFMKPRPKWFDYLIWRAYQRCKPANRAKRGKESK